MPAKSTKVKKTSADESPLKPGDCLCGIPNCPGHEIINGDVTVRNHPVHGNFVFKVPEKNKQSAQA